MRAAILKEANAPLVVETVEPVGLGPGDVLVKVGASGLCHSDLAVMAREGTPSMVMGHEGAGTVEEVGSEVTSLEKGDRVIASWVAPCGHCYWCVRDESHLCGNQPGAGRQDIWRLPDGSTVGAMAGIGTMAEYMLAPQQAMVKVETDLPDDQLALIGCGVTTGVLAAINAAKVKPGSSVAVVGCGGVGNSVIQGARIAGALTIIAVDPVAMKREVAGNFGATHGIDPTERDAAEAIKELTGGRGVDYAFEVTGKSIGADLAWASIRRGGLALAVGMGTPTDVSDGIISGKRFMYTLYGDANPHRDMPMLVRMAERGQLDLGAMVSRHIKLDEVNEGLEAIEGGEVIRSVIVN